MACCWACRVFQNATVKSSTSCLKPTSPGRCRSLLHSCCCSAKRGAVRIPATELMAANPAVHYIAYTLVIDCMTMRGSIADIASGGTGIIGQGNLYAYSLVVAITQNTSATVPVVRSRHWVNWSLSRSPSSCWSKQMNCMSTAQFSLHREAWRQISIDVSIPRSSSR